MEKTDRTRLPYIVSGTGRSGTTFLIHVFLQAGWDCGDLNPKGIGVDCPTGGGLEYTPFALLNQDIQREMLNKGTPPAELAQSLYEKMSQPWPKIIKDPRYSVTWPVWEAAGMRPEHVFLSVRLSTQTNESIALTDWHKPHAALVYQKAYDLQVYCLENDIPFTPVLYPRLALDREYAERTLGDFIQKPWSVIQKVWDPALLHHNP